MPSNVRRRLGRILAGLAAAGMLAACSLQAAAQTYELPKQAAEGYQYNVWGESVPAPDYYTYETAFEMGLRSPSDLFVLGDELYIMDAGNGRVAVADAATGEFRREIRPVGEDVPSLEDARGIYVTEDKRIYITLFNQKKIAVLNDSGAVQQIIGEPEGPLVPSDFAYNPKRIAVQPDGLIYVVAEGSYQGIVQFSQDGTFRSFFGSNKVTATAATVITWMWRKIFNDAQKDRLEKTLPTDYSSITIGPDGFVYSTTARATDSTAEIKKHSPVGNNVLQYDEKLAPGVKVGGNDYGDLENSHDSTILIDTRFTDLAVDSRGFIYGLDTQRGKVFQYDQNSHLMGIFGTKAEQLAAFCDPVSIDLYDGKVYVLDEDLAQVMVFRPTAYAAALEEALELYGKGQFAKAEPAWEIVRGYNTNLELCAAGLGRAALERGDYARAMALFEEGKDRGGYDEAFLVSRNNLMHRYFFLLFAGMLAALIGVFVLLGRKAKKGAFEVDAGGRKKLNPFHLLWGSTR